MASADYIVVPGKGGELTASVEGNRLVLAIAGEEGDAEAGLTKKRLKRLMDYLADAYEELT